MIPSPNSNMRAFRVLLSLSLAFLVIPVTLFSFQLLGASRFLQSFNFQNKMFKMGILVPSVRVFLKHSYLEGVLFWLFTQENGSQVPKDPVLYLKGASSLSICMQTRNGYWENCTVEMNSMPASVSALTSRPAFRKEESTVISPVMATANLETW